MEGVGQRAYERMGYAVILPWGRKPKGGIKRNHKKNFAQGVRGQDFFFYATVLL